MGKELQDVSTFGSFQSTRKTDDIVSFSLSAETESNIKIKALVTPIICPPKLVPRACSETPIVTLWSSCAPKHVLWQRVFRSASEFKVRNLIQWTGHFAIYVRWLFGWRYISSLHSADDLQQERNSCPLLRSCFIGSCHVGVSKRFPVVSALQSFAFIHFILVDQTSCRSYVGSVYRMRSLAVGYSAVPRAFSLAWGRGNWAGRGALKPGKRPWERGCCPLLSVMMKKLKIPPELKGLKLADRLQSSEKSWRGYNHWKLLLRSADCWKNNKNWKQALIAIESKFGWLLSGPVQNRRALCQRIEIMPVQESKLDNL